MTNESTPDLYFYALNRSIFAKKAIVKCFKKSLTLVSYRLLADRLKVLEE